MTSELTLQLLIAGAVLYQFTIVSLLSIWLWRDGVRVSKTTEISAETTAERKRVATIGVVFWLVVGTIIVVL